MTTLDRYRKCFEACGIGLPDGHSWSEYGRAGMNYGETIRWGLQEASALCVCRCAAEDWLRREEGWSVELLCEIPNDIGAVVVAAQFDDDEGQWMMRRIHGDTIHARLIAACYAVAGKEEA